MNLFDSIDAVRQFAGRDYKVPVLEPEAKQLLSKVQPVASHYEVRADTVDQGQRPNGNGPADTRRSGS